MANHIDPPAMPTLPPMPRPPDARIIPLDRQTPLTHAQVEQVRFGLGDTGPLAQAVMNANVPALAKQLATGAVSCLSTRRPADPVVGQMIFETDTQQVRFWTGTAWVTPANASPTGSLQAFAGSAAPTGWLLCDGSAVSRTTYSGLFAVVSTAYGVGDGSTTFGLPDLRGRVPAGKDDMGGTAANRLTAGGSGVTGTTLGASGGAETYTLTTAQIPAHGHTFSVTGTVDGGAAVNFGSNYTVGARTSFSGTTANAGGGGAHNNAQPTIITNYIIKT